MARGALRDHLSSFTLGEIMRWDLLVAAGAAAAAGYWEWTHPEEMRGALALVVGLVGVVIGSVVAGSALIAAFFDQAFLRKLRLIKKDPTRYVTPFMFTAVLGIVGALALTVLAALPPPDWPAARLVAAILGYGAAVWSLTSLVQNLDTLIQFIGLQQDAAGISEERLAYLEDREQSAGPPQEESGS